MLCILFVCMQAEQAARVSWRDGRVEEHHGFEGDHQLAWLAQQLC
jgi:hypothetical protein